MPVLEHLEHLRNLEKLCLGFPYHWQGSTESTIKSATLNVALNDVVLKPKGHMRVDLYLFEGLLSNFVSNVKHI